MASVFNRGSKDNPRWYIRIKDASGVWRSIRTRQLTKTDARRVAQEMDARAERERLGIDKIKAELCSVLFRDWSMGLRNRSSRDDIGRLKKHVIPRFGHMRLDELTMAEVVKWLDEERTAGVNSPATVRHCLALISRFFGWCILRGFVQHNPVRSIPVGYRPMYRQRRDIPWVSDDGLVLKIMEALPAQFALMFFIGNRSGLRLGEICGLRLSDVAGVAEGRFRVRYSYNGPLKEDRKCTGMVKIVPAPRDADSVLGDWIALRRAQGATDESPLFCRQSGGLLDKEIVKAAWIRARDALGLGTLTWTQATRHSFASRNLERGAALDDVSQALGHKTPAVTKDYFVHVLKRKFSGVIVESMVPPGSKVRRG